MIVVLFESRPTATGDAKEYAALGLRLRKLVEVMPGFVSLDVFQGAHDATLIVARFDGEEAETRWRLHPEHLAAQARREDFYVAYDVQVCSVIRGYGWQSAAPS